MRTWIAASTWGNAAPTLKWKWMIFYDRPDANVQVRLRRISLSICRRLFYPTGHYTMQVPFLDESGEEKIRINGNIFSPEKNCKNNPG